MRAPRVRLTMRSMLVAVAVAAVVMFVIVKPMWDRAHWGRIGQHHLEMANIYLHRAESEDEADRDTKDKLIARYKWHSSMAARYLRAATYPGMPEPRGSPPPDS